MKVYEFKVWVTISGESNRHDSNLKRLVVGCVAGINPLNGILYNAISNNIGTSENVNMQMPGIGWSTRQIYTFTSPTSSVDHCYVIENKIFDITVDGLPHNSNSPAPIYFPSAAC